LRQRELRRALIYRVSLVSVPGIEGITQAVTNDIAS
jgi:hypothetical protein